MKLAKEILEIRYSVLAGALILVSTSLTGVAPPSNSPVPTENGAEDIQPPSTPPPTPTSTPVSETPTPTPTPEDQCDVVRFDFSRANEGQIGGTLSESQMFDLSKVPPGFSCINDKVNAALNCAKFLNRHDSYWDDEVMSCLSTPVFGTYSWDGVRDGNNSFPVTAAERSRTLSEKKAYCQKKSFVHISGKVNCVTGHVVYDANCNPQPLNPDGSLVNELLNICPAAVTFLKSSPLSLVWEEGADRSPSVSVVSFPVNPQVPDAEYSWKASAKLPLVVYDPEHRGVITQAKQLFGNWTFGGKTVAALNSDVAGSAGQPWENGYQALATLDLNHDGEVSGAELAPLGLWFDNNQNGISEPGEVRELSSQGVTALFYQPSETDEASHTIRAARGFTRSVDGKTVSGASIDWYAARSNSAHTLIEGLLNGARADGDNSEFGANPAADAAVPAAPSSDTSINNDFSGVWEWRLEGSEQSASIPDGYLMLKVENSGKVSGVSLTPTYFGRTSKNGSAKLDMFEVSGLLKQTGADRTVALEIRNGHSVSRSQVKLDGKTLRGETAVYISDSSKKDKIAYRWYAVRKKQA